MELIEKAAAERREAADRLAEAEAALTAADRALKRAEADLAAAREARVRAEGAVAQASEARGALVERFRERLECAPEEALAIAELDPGEELPEREQTESRIQRLIRERENIGPVNLRAETEATEIETQLSGLQNERGDLVSAIARLRQGISSLNREGRERLLAAFEVVNKNFEELFTRLFGGGRAHLALTENDDPLEAGLEIMASPPGKRLQVLSLLSGGEQALTALALLFGVFLANPTPICVLDEVDAPLDDANVDRFCTLIEELGHSSGHAIPGDHPSPDDHGPDGPPLRRHHGRARRLAARLRRPAAGRRAARDGVKSSRHLRYLAAASCRLTGLGLNLKVPPPCGSGMMTFAAGPPDLRDR